jgi:lysophospholipase L1-like esterase
MFAGGDEASRHLSALYAGLADELGCGFFDAGSVAATTPIDGVHLDAENTRAIGAALAPLVRVMLEL